MPTIVQIPGLGEVEFPDEMSLDQIQAQVVKLVKPQQPSLQTSPPGPTVSGIINRGGPFPGGALEPAPESPEVHQSMGRRFGAGFLANVISTPSAVGKLISSGDDAAREVLGFPPTDTGLAKTLAKFPSPSTEEVAAAGRMVSQLPKVIMGPETMSGEFQRQLELQQQAAEQHPIQTAISDIGADAATLLTARPLTRALFPAARSAPTLARESVDIIDSAANRLAKVTGFSKRLGAQAGEAGFEGALLAAMGDGDPLATAGWAAGTQAGGALALQGSKAFVQYPWRSLGGIALAHWIYRALAPGGQGAIEDVRDETVQTMLTTFGLGTLAAMAGAGRLAPGRTAGRDRFIDSFDTLRRAPVISIIKQLNAADESGDDRLGRIIEKLAQDPDYFGREVRMRIERASRSEKPQAMIREVDGLMRSARFRRQFDAIERSE